MDVIQMHIGLYKKTYKKKHLFCTCQWYISRAWQTISEHIMHLQLNLTLCSLLFHSEAKGFMQS